MSNIPNLNIAMVQFAPKWLDFKANLEYLSQLPYSQDLQLIILPEMFATGFCMQTEYITEEQSTAIIQWMEEFSRSKNIAIAGSVAIKEDNGFYNRFYFYDKGSCLATYNKRHLFSYSGENLHFVKGNERIVFDFEGWKICPQICYDLRFPVWFRNTGDYDILLNVANWPESRIAIWDNLLQARAIENMCYSIGVNRIGTDGNQLNYNGHSNLCFPSHEKMNIFVEDTLIYGNLNYQKLKEYQDHYPFLKDEDQFILKP